MVLAVFIDCKAATTNQWTGQISTVWEEAANWSLNSCPTFSDDVTIPSVSNNRYPVLNSDVTVHNLNVQSGATLTIASGCELVVNGVYTLNGILYGKAVDCNFPSLYNSNDFVPWSRIYITFLAKKFYQITPLQYDRLYALCGWDESLYKVYEFDQNSTTNNGWTNLTYWDEVRQDQPINVIFKNEKKKGQYYTPYITQPYNFQEGWFHVGNPYMNWIDVSGIEGLNYTNKKVYQYREVNGEDVVVITDLSDRSADDPRSNGKIAPKRAFWMYAKEAGSYRINPDMKCEKNTNRLKYISSRDQSQVVKLTCGINEQYDYAAIKLGELGADHDVADALKYEIQYQSIPSLAIVKNQKNYTIAQVSLSNQQQEIPITITIPNNLKNVDLDLKFFNVKDFDSGYELYLKNDKGEKIDFRKESVYTFSTEKEKLNFSLIIKSISTMIENVSDSNAFICYCEDRTININNINNEPFCKYEVFDITGKYIEKGDLKRNKQISIDKPGIYVVTIKNSHLNCVKKVVVH